MKRVLVLCTGNSCRSQMAEGYLQFYAQGKALAFSAGLEDHGVNAFTLKVMAEDNIDISTHHSKQLRVFKGQQFDYLISVCEEVDEKTLKDITYKHKLHFSIPDPAGFEGTDAEKIEEFRRVRELVKKNVLKFIGQVLFENSELVA